MEILSLIEIWFNLDMNKRLLRTLAKVYIRVLLRWLSGDLVHGFSLVSVRFPFPLFSSLNLRYNGCFRYCTQTGGCFGGGKEVVEVIVMA